MFKEHRLVHEHGIEAAVAAEVAPGSRFQNLFELTKEVFGEGAAQAKYQEILTRAKEACEAATKGKKPADIPKIVEDTVRRVLDAEVRILDSRLLQRTQSLAQSAQKKGWAVMQEPPTAPARATPQPPATTTFQPPAGSPARPVGAGRVYGVGGQMYDDAGRVIGQPSRAPAAQKGWAVLQEPPTAPARAAPQPPAATPQTPAGRLPRKPEPMVYSDAEGVLRDMHSGEPVKGAGRVSSKAARTASAAKSVPKAAEKAAEAAAREAELLKQVQAGKNVPVSKLTEFGWRVVKAIQNEKLAYVLVKGGRVLARGGKALAVVGRGVGRVVGKAALPLQILAIGYDIYVGGQMLHNEVTLIKQKRKLEGKDPDAPITLSDLVTHIATNPDLEREETAKQVAVAETEAYEIASQKVGFLNKAHEACVYAKGVIHDIRAFSSQLSQFTASGWDVLMPGKLLGETLATDDARTREKVKLADNLRNGAARLRSLRGQLSAMPQRQAFIESTVAAALESTASLADSTAKAEESPDVSASDAIFDMVHVAQGVVEKARREAREEKRERKPKQLVS